MTFLPFLPSPATLFWRLRSSSLTFVLTVFLNFHGQYTVSVSQTPFGGKSPKNDVAVL